MSKSRRVKSFTEAELGLMHKLLLHSLMEGRKALSEKDLPEFFKMVMQADMKHCLSAYRKVIVAIDEIRERDKQ